MNVIVDGWGQVVRFRLSDNLAQKDFAASSDTGLLLDNATRDRLATLPVIEEQSDGVRSFAGILLTLLTVPYPLILLDEPEAFLHPPQARLLGRYLAALRQEGQLFVATHSLDILLGLVEANAQDVMIVRLTRANGKTTASPLQPERVEKLWRDPLLRFSKAFDGLFHEGVVVCEGDTDSQFYSAVTLELAKTTVTGTDAEPEQSADALMVALTANPFDVMFTYAGGKQRMALVAEALAAVKVPVRIIADFDVLNESRVVADLVKSLGASYTDDLEKKRSIVDAHLRGSEAKLTVDMVKARIEEVLGEDGSVDLTKPMAAGVRDALRPASGWSAAHSTGRAAVPSGEATVALVELLNRLADLGIFVVPSGTVETFVKAVGMHGPKWVVQVIEGGYIESAQDAKDFVSAVLRSLSEPVE
jgi:hypothetical protein